MESICVGLYAFGVLRLLILKLAISNTNHPSGARKRVRARLGDTHRNECPLSRALRQMIVATNRSKHRKCNQAALAPPSVLRSCCTLESVGFIRVAKALGFVMIP